MPNAKPFERKKRSRKPNKKPNGDAQKRPRVKQEGKAHENKKKPPTSAFRVFVKRPEPWPKSSNQHAGPSLQRSGPKFRPKKTLLFKRPPSLHWENSNRSWPQTSRKSERRKLEFKVDWMLWLNSAKVGKVLRKASERYWSGPKLTPD